MRYLILVLTIMSGVVFAQNPLESRVYKVGKGSIKYEANLKLDFETFKYYVDKDGNGNPVNCKHVKGGKFIKKFSTFDEIKTVYKNYSFVNSLENIQCANFAKDTQEKIPTGFGNLSFGSFNGGAEAKATLLRYNIHYSSRGYIPFYLLATTTAGDNINPDNVKTNLFGTDSGLLNFKLADDVITFNKYNQSGICNFDANQFLSGGCYLNYQLGVKMVEYTNEDGSTDDLIAGYTSIQFAVDLPITKVSDKAFARAGRLIAAAGLSAYYANTDKVQNLFPEFKDNNVGKVDDLKEFYASFDAGLKFTLTDVLDINVKATMPLTNRDVFDNQIHVSFSWTPDETVK